MQTIIKAGAKTAGLLPASLADTQLDHVERMVQYLTHNMASAVDVGFDSDYWRKRLRTLSDTYDLVATQRKRLLGLLDRLEREIVLNLPRA
ncbi:hypothetical protein [Paraburkholderia acidisoli]|uniref:Uncharacterized protein n=1 Tax=Paraburkholderia acidisoli TaxID=2571748 RepID=A0A7Z2GR96_9BURK|nr:hypothetical protein [Paraburkholderia acidisoli]QGZ66511.1 hypothetical protein FAZ98_32565 [Paraburkholderia acidisoli]